MCIWSVTARLGLTKFSWLRLGAFEHIMIPVRDLVIARKFYCDALGIGWLMTVTHDTFRRFWLPPVENNGEGAHHVSV